MAETQRYLFSTTSNNPCDRCDMMEGEHDTRPQVPVHPYCECEVDVLAPEHPAGDDSGSDDEEIDFTEVRNIEIMESEYTLTVTAATWENIPEDKTLTVQVDLGLHDEDLDEPLTVDDLDIDIPSGEESDSVDIPAHSSGEVTYDVVITVYIVKAELWRVYTVTRDGVALVEEEHIGDVGGFVEVRSELANVTLDATEEPPPEPSDPADPSDPQDGYFEEGDGVPS